MHSTEQLNTALDGRYVIERRIGEGGMAVVYLARDVKHGRHVAMKVVHPELAAVIGAERFLSEIHVTANLQHPHILPLFDSGEVREPHGSTLLYYVMPYVEGESLRTRLERDQQLSIDDAVRITREVAAALDYAHRHGVVHRDIKPENILLHDGSALVADFGIALAVSNAGGTRLTQTGLSLGTPHYMSPEQASGVKQLDGRADLYSLGCVLYEMLTGEPPFTGHNAQAVVARVLTETARPIRSARSTVPDWLEAVALTALAKLPADRFASAAEMAEALNAGGSRSTRATLAHSPTALPRGRIRAWQAATAAAVTVAAIASYFAVQRPSGDSHGLQLARQLTFDGNVIGAEISPDGLWLAYVTEDCLGRDFSCGNSLQVREVDGTQSVPIAKWPRIETDVKWSPDGSTIVFRGSPDTTAVTLYLAPRLGGSLRAVPVSPNAFSFNADGRSLLCAVGNVSHSSLVRFDLSTLSPLDSVSLPPGFNYVDVSVSPDGSLIAAIGHYRGTVRSVLLFDSDGRLADSAALNVRPRIRGPAPAMGST